MKNAAALAKPPRIEEPEEEIDPYSVEEVQSLLIEVNKRRNSARWMLALALGLRQGETLGLRWSDVDLANEYLKLRRNRLRPRYAHGCREAAPCGRKAGYCPERKQMRRETKNTKSRAGRRAVPLPGPLVLMLRSHGEAQAREREAAGSLWIESDYVFTKPLGGPLSPNTDYHDWKRLLDDAGGARRAPSRRPAHGRDRPDAARSPRPRHRSDHGLGTGHLRTDAREVPARARRHAQGCGAEARGRGSGDRRRPPLWTKTRTTGPEATTKGPTGEPVGPFKQPGEGWAEDKGFEPLRGCPQHAFQACALGH